MALPFSLAIPYRFDLKSALSLWECALHTLIHTFAFQSYPLYLWAIRILYSFFKEHYGVTGSSFFPWPTQHKAQVTAEGSRGLLLGGCQIALPAVEIL